MLTFDDSLDPDTGQRKHEYRWNGTRVPSATQIMKAVGFDPYFGENRDAMERGRLVHLTCQLHDENDLDESTLDPVLAGYLEGWKRFRKEWTPERTTVVDIKTGGTPFTVGIQTAFYELLLRDGYHLDTAMTLIEAPMYHEGLMFAGTPDRVYVLAGKDAGPVDRLAVRLSEDGKYSVTHCRRRKDRDIARAALAVFFDSMNRCQ